MPPLNLNEPIDLLFVIAIFAVIAALAVAVYIIARHSPMLEEKRFSTASSGSDDDENGSEEYEDEEDDDDNILFEIVEEYEDYDIVCCTVTKVMYAVSTGYRNCGTFTLLVNPDGTPMLYKEEYFLD